MPTIWKACAEEKSDPVCRIRVVTGVHARSIVVGLIAFDALIDEDDLSGNSDSVDAVVENALRATAEAGSDNPYAYLGLEQLPANTGRLAEAIPWFEQGIELDPENSSIRVDFARALVAGAWSGMPKLSSNGPSNSILPTRRPISIS